MMDTIQTIALCGLVLVGLGVVFVTTCAVFYQAGGNDREADLVDAFAHDRVAFDLHFTNQAIEQIRAETLEADPPDQTQTSEPVRGRHS